MKGQADHIRALETSLASCKAFNEQLAQGAMGNLDRIGALEAAVRDVKFHAGNKSGFGLIWQIAALALGSEPETACELCEGSGESGVNHHDGTQYSTKTPPCPDCGGSGKKATKGDASG
jgi:hypothetical protein